MGLEKPGRPGGGVCDVTSLHRPDELVDAITAATARDPAPPTCLPEWAALRAVVAGWV